MMRLCGGLAHNLKVGIVLSVFVLTSGCSFHSSQWDAVRRLLQPSEIVVQDRWFLSGPVSDRRVYPVQVSGAIMFTDGEAIFLKFDGWHFVEMRGLPRSFYQSTSDLQRTIAFNYIVTDDSKSGSHKKKAFAEGSMLSNNKNSVLYEAHCEEWQQVPVISGKLLSQSCLFDSQEAFSNSIWLDQSGNIRAIESVVGPGGDKIRVAMRDL